jgi:hypothetical protein
MKRCGRFAGQQRTGEIMGDSRRFNLLAGVIQRTFPLNKYQKIADVAGGKGYLQLALREKGYVVTTFDKRKKCRNQKNKFEYQYRYFDERIRDHFDLLVGMHPDEATDLIIVEAYKRKIPFVVCPCCVKPNMVTYWGKHTYKHWIKHLIRLAEDKGYTVSIIVLGMNGKNLVLIGKI